MTQPIKGNCFYVLQFFINYMNKTLTSLKHFITCGHSIKLKHILKHIKFTYI